MKILITLIIAFLSLGAASLVAAEAGGSKTLKMKIDGMMCIECKEKVEKQLASVCKKVSVDVKHGECFCEYEGKVTPKRILSEVDKAGYKAALLK